MNPRKLILSLGALAAAVLLPLYSYKIWSNPDYTDFLVYYRAAERIQAGNWEQIYSLTLDGNSPFRYAPLTLPAFAPLTLLSFKLSQLVWFWLQYLLFGLGFLQLKKLLASLGVDATLIATLAFLMSARFCIDSFTIGQITGLLFFLVCASCRAFCERNYSCAGLLILIPTTLKLGFGIFYPLLWMTPEAMKRGVRPVFFGGVMLWLVLILMTGLSAQGILWRDWFHMLRMDSQFFDSAHYGTQSLNSALLRLAKAGWISGSFARLFYGLVLVQSCLSLFLHWFRMNAHARTPQERLRLFSLGIMAYLILMPFTFKYSLPFLAIPWVTLLAGRKNLLDRTVLILSGLTLSLAGLDLIGPTLFFWLQHHSVPLLMMLLMTGALILRSNARDWKIRLV